MEVKDSLPPPYLAVRGSSAPPHHVFQPNAELHHQESVPVSERDPQFLINSLRIIPSGTAVTHMQFLSHGSKTVWETRPWLFENYPKTMAAVYCACMSRLRRSEGVCPFKKPRSVGEGCWSIFRDSGRNKIIGPNSLGVVSFVFYYFSNGNIIFTQELHPIFFNISFYACPSCLQARLHPLTNATDDVGQTAPEINALIILLSHTNNVGGP